jgi:hypothetical protein
VINPYELLDTLFPGSFPREARFKLAESPARDTRLNLQEAAEYLGITTRKLKDLCREKRITHTRIDYHEKRMTTQTTISEYLLLGRGTHWDKGLSPEEIRPQSQSRASSAKVVQ